MAGSENVTALLEPEQLERIKELTLVARRVVEGALHGLHRSPHFGLSVEFSQHREYTPGDELKHLDWQVLARSDKYVVKRYEQETNLRAVILLDSSNSMAYAGPGPARVDDNKPKNEQQQLAAYMASKYRYGQVLAAACASVMLQQGDSVGLIVSSDKIERQAPPRAASSHLASICRVLTEVEPGGETNLPAVITQLATRLVRRSLVVLISDLFDDGDALLSALGQLHHRGHEVVVFQVLDPHEQAFDLGMPGRGVTVVRDMETGAEFEAEPHLVRELVQEEVRRYLARLDQGARNHGFDLLRCVTDQLPQEVLGRYMRRRLSRHGR